jgi:hypothetical protein
METVVSAARLVTPIGVLAPGWLLMNEAGIIRIGSGILPGRSSERLDGWLMPAPAPDSAQQPLGLAVGGPASFCLVDTHFGIVAQWQDGRLIKQL